MSKIETTHFIYDGAKLIGEYNSDGSVKNEYIYLNGTPLAVISRHSVLDTESNKVYYIHTDHLGTPRRLADENGAIVWSWESKAFGDDEAVGNMAFNLRFAGQYFDNETSMHYNINRDYNPKTGRYIESDPIGFDGGVNSYGYVAGNPLGAVDELGLARNFSGFVTSVVAIGTGYSISYGTFDDRSGGKRRKGKFKSYGPSWGLDISAGGFQGTITSTNSWSDFQGYANVYSAGAFIVSGALIYDSTNKRKIGYMVGNGFGWYKYGVSFNRSYTQILSYSFY